MAHVDSPDRSSSQGSPTPGADSPSGAEWSRSERPTRKIPVVRIDRRLGQRLPWRTEVCIWRSQDVLMAWSHDLSTGGIFLETEPALAEVGSTLRLVFALPDCALFDIEAKVKWITAGDAALDRPAGLGLGFVRLQARALAGLARFIAHHRIDEGAP